MAHRLPPVLGVLTALTTSCGLVPGDDSGIGGFDRTWTARLAVEGTIDADGRPSISTQQAVDGRIGDPRVADERPPVVVIDALDYGPEPGVDYQMLLAPTVPALRREDAGPGQWTLLYLHDPRSDAPAGDFPTREIFDGQTPTGFLDCLRTSSGSTTRFDGLVAAVEDGSLFDGCRG